MGHLSPAVALANRVTKVALPLPDEFNLFPDKMHFFPTIDFRPHSMKMAELGKDALVSCIIDFDDIQL